MADKEDPNLQAIGSGKDDTLVGEADDEVADFGAPDEENEETEEYGNDDSEAEESDEDSEEEASGSDDEQDILGPNGEGVGEPNRMKLEEFRSFCDNHAKDNLPYLSLLLS